MKEIFGEFKKEASHDTYKRLYEKLALVKDELREEFKAEFPDLEPDLFLKSERWLEISGTTYDEAIAEEVPTEVEVWVTRQITALIESL